MSCEKLAWEEVRALIDMNSLGCVVRRAEDGRGLNVYEHVLVALCLACLSRQLGINHHHEASRIFAILV
jgi:hypothetical protein